MNPEPAQPIRLLQPGDLYAGLDSDPGALALLAFAGALFALLLVVQHLQRTRPGQGTDLAERAFRALLRGEHLSRAEVRVVERLAQAAGIAPVALLLSEGAFTKAILRADGPSSEHRGQRLATHERLRRRLFDESATRNEPAEG